MTALEIAKQLIQAVQDNDGKDMECLIEYTDELMDVVADASVSELSIERRNGLNNPPSIKFIM